MDGVQIIRRLHQHRRWVNENLLESASALTDEQLQRSFPIGQGSIWKTLTHLYAAEYHWLKAMQGIESPLVPGDVAGKLPGNQLGEGGFRDLKDLKQKWSVLEEEWDCVLGQLTSESLEEIVHKVAASAPVGTRLSARRSDVLLHVSTHAQYTTAQLINMLRQLGVEKFPQTMLIALARQEAAAQTPS